jgi:D-lactate dehydrogenase (cytochrome)
VQLMFTSDEGLVKTKKLVKAMVSRAIALGGTCTGEHGVGIGKREYLYEELGYGAVELVKKIKRTIDPLNLFNPGKVSLSLLFHADDVLLGFR